MLLRHVIENVKDRELSFDTSFFKIEAISMSALKILKTGARPQIRQSSHL